MAPELEAQVLVLRDANPRWGPTRIVYELGREGVVAVPGRSSVYRALVRNGRIDPAPPPATAQGVTYEVKGPGTALTINIEPGGIRLENVPLPVPSEPGQLLEVIGVPSGDLTTNPGCRITVDGVVRADKPNGSDGLCVVTQ